MSGPHTNYQSNFTRLQASRPEALCLVEWQDKEMAFLLRGLTHDLRAHMILLDASVRRLKTAVTARKEPAPDLCELVAHIEACVLGTHLLVEDLAALGRKGKIELAAERADVNELLQEVLFEQQEVLKERGVEVEIQGPLPVVWCNRHRLKQVLGNLVGNALRHGCDPMHPRIVIAPWTADRRTPQENPAGRTGFQIYDNGRGIPREFHEAIFRPGVRLPQARGEGWGLGLAIVRKTVEQYGGAVWVDERCQSGTRFVVVLPCPPATEGSKSASGDLSVDHDPHPPVPWCHTTWGISPLDGENTRMDGR